MIPPTMQVTRYDGAIVEGADSATAQRAAAAEADVTICIPAYQGEQFIDRTLRCARRQTYQDLKILVSVDKSTDDTVRICDRHAREDDRIRIFEQTTRLGWAQNVNFLLDRIDTEFFFIYFHDDIIEPDYVEVLRKCLFKRPDAIGAHCTVAYFGNKRDPSVAIDYEGSAAERLMKFLVLPERGPLFRGLMRRKSLRDGLRLRSQPDADPFAGLAYVMAQVAAGPILAVAAPLYKRWHQREGGLIKNWSQRPLDQILDGWRATTCTAVRVVGDAAATDRERQSLLFCLYLFVMFFVRTAEWQRRAAVSVSAREIHEEFAGMTLPPTIDDIETAMRQAIIRRYAELLFREGRSALARNDRAAAAASLARAVDLDPGHRGAGALLAKARNRQGAVRPVLGRAVSLLRAVMGSRKR